MAIVAHVSDVVLGPFGIVCWTGLIWYLKIMCKFIGADLIDLHLT